MKRLAAVLENLAQPGQDRAARLARYLDTAPEARALLSIPRLIPPATLRDWIAQDTGLPDWLIDTSRSASPDLAETLALLLPPATGPEPTLAEVLADLQSLPPGPLARAAILQMAARLPTEPRALYFRLITGTFRSPRPRTTFADPLRPRHQILTVMTHAEPALRSGVLGPEVTLAVRNGPDLIPIARAIAALPEGQTPALLAWIRANATTRFGPLRAVPATQVFTLAFTALTHNRRRKSGLALTDPHILAHHPDLDAAQITDLADLTAHLPIRP